MSTATSVPSTLGLEGDDALVTLRATGRRRLALDAFDRFRAADGFSHARALAFQFTLTLVPALITVIGLATALDQDTFTRVVREVLGDLAPGAAGDLSRRRCARAAPAPGRRTASSRSRSAGSRPSSPARPRSASSSAARTASTASNATARRCASTHVAAALMLTAGVATLLAAMLLVAGETLADAAGLGSAFDLLRWPVAIALVVGAWRCCSRSRRAGASPSRRGSRSALASPRCCGCAFTGALAAVRGRERELRRHLRPARRDDRDPAVDVPLGASRCCSGSRSPPSSRPSAPASPRRASSATRTRAGPGSGASSPAGSRRACACASPGRARGGTGWTGSRRAR